MTILALVRDLMFSSKIAATARAANVDFKIVRDPKMLVDLTGNRLIVDLNQPDALEAAVEWKSRTAGTVIGFVAHVDTGIIQRARDAGFDQVLPRSAFVASLDAILTR